MKQLKVDPIKDGTVIDHIPAGKAFTLFNILKLDDNDQVMIGTNLISQKLGKKDIIKIENRELSAGEVNSVALIAPGATFSIIRDSETISKTQLSLPNVIRGIIRCPNEKCITTIENVESKFEVESTKPIKVRCIYCEKIYKADDLGKFINVRQEN
jgi:aspartate carbamoyltransferase regulatory subunit